MPAYQPVSRKFEPADREFELDLFEKMVSGQSAERILLLEAEGGMGKSTLLSEFMRRLTRQPTPVDAAPVDLKGSSVGLHQIFNRLCDVIGWDHFTPFESEVKGLGQQVNMSGNKIIGRAEIEVALHSPDEGDRAARRAALTRAFFTDLRALQRPLLFIFDTFEQAPLEVREWLQSSFLAYARRTPTLTVIVAGRQIPAESIEWAACCVSHHLPPIPDHRHWQSYCRAAGLALHGEAIKAFCILFKGKPNEIDKALAAVAGQGGSQ